LKRLAVERLTPARGVFRETEETVIDAGAGAAVDPLDMAFCDAD
jgi:hypothetical protein